MAGLGGRGFKAVHRRFVLGISVITALACVMMTVCTESLGLKSLIRDEVARSKIGLVLYDGAAAVEAGGTVAFPDTIFGDTFTKTLALKNEGHSNVTLTGPGAVSITGGSGAAAYGNIVQPAQVTLLPGGTATFTVDYTPPLADADYACDFVVNSDDSSYPAYAFHGSGRSTQWHGSKAIVSSPSTVYGSPHIAIDTSTDPDTIYVSYLASGIDIQKSTDGGKTWTGVVQSVSSPYYHSLAASNGNLHVFYMNTSYSPYRLQYVKLPRGYVSWQSVIYYSANTSYYGMSNSSVVLAGGNVYLVFNDTTNNKLVVSSSMDLEPMYMSFTARDITGGSTGQTGGFFPSLRFAGSVPYMTYLDGKAFKIAYGSLTSPSYKTIYTDATYNMGADSLAVNGANGVALVGYNSNDLYSTASSTLGGTNAWSAPAALTGGMENSSLSENLSLAWSGSELYAVYYRYSSTSGLRFAKSLDQGTTWSFQWLDNDLGSSGASSSLAVAGDCVYIVYSTPSGHPNGYSITIRKSLDRGASW